MANFDPIEIDFLINKNEVKADAKTVKDEIRGVVKEAEGVNAKVNKQVSGLFKGSSVEIDKEAQRVVDLQNHYANLQKEIQKNSEARNKSFLGDSKTIDATADSIGNAAEEVEKLGAATEETAEQQEKARKSTGGLLGKYLSWTAALNVGLELLKEYGPVIIDYLKKMFLVKRALQEAALSQEVFNKAFQSTDYLKGVQSLTELKNVIQLVHEGLVDQSVAIDKYNELIGDTAGRANNLADAEQGLIDNSDAYIEMTFKKAAANLALEEAAKKALEAEQRRGKLDITDFSLLEQSVLLANAPFANDDNIVTKFFGNDIDLNSAKKRADKAANILQQEGDSLQNIYRKLIGEAETAAKKLNKSVFGDGGAGAKKIFDQRKKLLEQIAALDKEYARKTLTRDAEEQQALKDKFEKIRKLVQDFNNDPKNAKARISIDALDEIEGRASAALIYRQDTRALKEELAIQKKLFEEFEDYKKKFGTTAARDKYAEQLEGFQSYADALQQKVDQNKEAFAAVENGTATGDQVRRVQLITKELNEATKKQVQAFAEQLLALRDYNTKRNALVENYNELRLQLVKKGANDEVAELDRQHQTELDALDDAHIKKTKGYKELFESVGKLTVSTGKTLIANAKKLLETQNLSAETRAKILKLIAETEAELKNIKADDIFKVAGALENLGGALSELDSPGLAGIGSLLSGLASGMQDVINVQNADSSGDTAGAVAQGVNSLVKLITVIANASKKRKEAEEAYYRSVIGLQYDYNLALQDQIRLQSELTESVFISDYEGRLTSALAAVRNANEEYLTALRDLDKAQVITGQRNAVDFGVVGAAAGAGAGVGAAIGSVVPVIGTVIGAVVGAVVGGIIGLFGGKKKKDEYAAILGEYPELLQRSEDGVISLNNELANSLINNKLVNEETKQILENILAWGEALEEARAQIKEVIQDLSGNLSSELRDDLVSAFTAGEDAAIRMGDTVEKVLENIVGNLVFNRIFSDAFSTLEEDMAKSFDIGGDGSWVDDLSRFFEQANGLTDDFNQALSDAQREAGDFGFDIFQPDGGTNERGLAGGIRRELTEATGSELAGLYRGQYDVTKRHFELVQKQYDLDLRNFDATLAIMGHSALIERNTRQTVDQLILVAAKLEDIKNKKQEQSSRDLGLGG